MTRPLRIALFTYSTKPRGSVIHTLELAEALQQLGHWVCVYALDKDGAGFDRAVQCSVRLVPALSVAGEIEALIRQRIQEFVDFLIQDISNASAGYDIYHAQDCISANALWELRQKGLIPHFVRTVHHVDAFNSPYLQECQENSIYEPDRCFCVSTVWQEVLKRVYGREAARVYNGVNLQRFTSVPDGSESTLKERLGLTGKPIYLTIGGIEPRKNTLALLEAFSNLLLHQPEAQLVIAGGATLFDYQDYRDRCFAFIQQSHIVVGESLILPGVIADRDLPTLYRCANAFVFPSVTEGWGLVVLEAIASGLPVITTNQPPFTEFLSPQSALLIEVNQPSAIAEAMQQVVQPKQRRSLIHNSQSLCHDYTWEHSAQLHIQQYQILLSEG